MVINSLKYYYLSIWVLLSFSLFKDNFVVQRCLNKVVYNCKTSLWNGTSVIGGNRDYSPHLGISAKAVLVGI